MIFFPFLPFTSVNSTQSTAVPGVDERNGLSTMEFGAAEWPTRSPDPNFARQSMGHYRERSLHGKELAEVRDKKVPMQGAINCPGNERIVPVNCQIVFRTNRREIVGYIGKMTNFNTRITGVKKIQELIKWNEEISIVCGWNSFIGET